MLTQEQRLIMLECPKQQIDMVLDTDAYNEIDDQFAISIAVRAKNKLNLKALYAAPFFNSRSSSPADGMKKSYDEIKKLLNLAGCNYPVFKGAESYLCDENTPVVTDASKDLAERARNYGADHPLYVVAIGAITNIASALLLAPEIADSIVVVWLGGNSLDWPDNKEFNCMQDVAAARVVFNSSAPLVILPCMGVVSAFTTTEPELKFWLSGKNELCDYLVEHTIEAANEYAKGQIWSRVIWDVTAIGWLFNDNNKLMLDKLIPTPIPEYDHHYSFDFRRPLCRYVYHINRDALFSSLVRSLST